MTKNRSKKKASRPQKRGDSVFSEAWENMNEDMAKVMPDFLAKRLPSGKKKAWVVIVVTLVELVVLGVVGKLLYDWLAG